MKIFTISVLAVLFVISSELIAFPLSEYNLVVLGDLTTSSEVEGKAFIGGNLNGSSNYAIKLTTEIPGSEVSVRVGGSIQSGNISIQQGSLEVNGNINAGVNVNMNGGPGDTYAVGGSVFGNVNGATSIPLLTAVDVAAMTTSLNNWSTYFDSLTANSSINTIGQTVTFQILPGTSQAVFNLTINDVFGASITGINMTGASNADEIIINISGATLSQPSGQNMIGDFTATGVRDKVVWNFVDATSITTAQNIFGSILAPNANFANATAIEGSVGVASMTQNGEVHLPVSLVPEPTALLLLALGGAALKRRRAG